MLCIRFLADITMAFCSASSACADNAFRPGSSYEMVSSTTRSVATGGSFPVRV